MPRLKCKTHHLTPGPARRGPVTLLYMQDSAFPDGQACATGTLAAIAKQADPIGPFAEAVLPTIVGLIQGCEDAEGKAIRGLGRF